MATSTAPTARQAPAPRPRWAKRILLGRALPTASLRHERLGKPTALAVFASDNLSSVAYATEEILKVALPVLGAAAFGLVMPVTLGILAVLGILLFSYRQTIKAYPTAGGAYVVTKDNFGLAAAQVAGVSLLIDYVLTVAVSTSAGVAAMVSAAPGLDPYRVWIALGFVVLVAWGNLRGVRESGRIFAVPTYFFIGIMATLLVVGLARAAAGSLHTLPLPDDIVRTQGALSLFLVLHMFASGGAAVTGVEAISNGIPAFKPPEWRNARTTLMWMGTILGAMFLGLSFLASQVHAIPGETRTVIAGVGLAVFGRGALGTALFYALQAGTTAILILAANTSFADFPRLANFAAGDSFLPRQLRKRGHRGVFSNGILALAAASGALILAFRADVHRLIPLYAIGVFLSFTMSQAGMARHHLRLREPGWRRGLAINGVGAATTAVVTIVIGATKFSHGAWAIVVIVPILVVTLFRLNRQYERERRLLEGSLAGYPGDIEPGVALVVVDRVDGKTLHALQYARTIRPRTTRALHFTRDLAKERKLQRSWEEMGIDLPLVEVGCDGERGDCLAGYVAALPPDRDVTVIVPAPASASWWRRVRDGHEAEDLVSALGPYRRARLAIIRDHQGPGHPVIADSGGKIRLVPRARHVAVVAVDALDRAAIEAVRYARSLGAMEVEAVHAVVEPGSEERLIARWMDLGMPIPLDVIECWDRDVARALERYIVERSRPDTEVSVVLPRRDHPLRRHRLLHDRTSRAIARMASRYAHVDVTVVPYLLDERAEPMDGPRPAAVPRPADALTASRPAR